MRIGELLAESRAELTAAGCLSPALDAEILVGAGLGRARHELFAESARVVSQRDYDKTVALIARRSRREPVARILGRKEFWSLEFELHPDVLVPRPDSETLVEAGIAVIKDLAIETPRMLDLGTGSGCLLLALLSECPQTTGVGTDISAAAVATAKANARRLNLSERAEFLEHDWTGSVAAVAARGPYDVVISNPPYLANTERAALDPDVREYDPPRALFGGEDGLDAYRTIFAKLQDFVTPSAHILFECGDGQSAQIREIGEALGIVPVQSWPDLAGRERVQAFCLGCKLAEEK